MKNELIQSSQDYYRIEKAIHFLEENFRDQPDLRQMAKTAGLSEFHFQRVFRRWAGVSPKRFLQFVSKEYAKQLLKESNILDVSYAAGLSGPSRLHDLFIHCEAMTPGEYKEKGKGLQIDYGFHPTPFGECFIALTPRGICSLTFVEPDNKKIFLEKFRQDWKNAQLNQNQEKSAACVKNIFTSQKGPVHLLCRGTNFQIKVWEALLKIPAGTVVTYKTVARWIDHPQAVRAVGTAIGKNPIAYLIPCHRVIRGMGQLGGYRWGIVRKRAILGKERVDRLSV